MSALIINGGLGMDVKQAAAIVGIFGGFTYLMPLFGGYLADSWLGQKRATFYGAIIIALGHLSIAFSALFGMLFFFLGLLFIASGVGLFKTCSSVMVGMLYGNHDNRRDSGFTIFYMGINLGAFIAPLIVGLINKQYGWHWGFGIGGFGMLISLIIFYFKTLKDLGEFEDVFNIKSSFQGPKTPGITPKILAIAYVIIVGIIVILQYNAFISLDPIAISRYMTYIIASLALLYFLYLFVTSSDSKSRRNLITLFILLIAAAIFWSTFEQQAIAFNLFADKYTDRNILGFVIPTEWFQSINPLIIIIFAPILGYIWIALDRKGFGISSFSKFALGLVFAGLGYVIMYFGAKVLLSTGTFVSPLWLASSFFLLTIGELCLSPIGLSVMTQIAPDRLKSQMMGLWFVSSTLGYLVAGILGGHVGGDDLSSMPDLFKQIALTLFIPAIVLFILIFLLKLRKRSQNKGA